MNRKGEALPRGWFAQSDVKDGVCAP